MRLRFGSYLMLPPVLLLLLLMVACAGASNVPTTTAPQAAPPAQAAATALPASARMAMEQFVQQQREVNVNWDKYHREFDQWRAGLTACHRSSAQSALRDFAVGFNSITQQTRDLPRTATTREPADILIEAAGAEETAFRQLRDRWQPNNISLFEAVEELRSDAALAQKKAEDLTIDLQEELEEGSDPEEVASVEEFSEAYDDLKEAWKQFHDDFSDLRKNADGMEQAEVVAELEQLLEQLDDIVEAIADIPSSDATEDMIDMLVEAAKHERDVLKSVADSFASDPTPPPPPTPDATTGAGEAQESAGSDGVPTATPPNADSGLPTPSAPPDPGMSGEAGDAFDEMDIAVSDSEDVLDSVSRSIKAVIDDSPAESLAEIEDFNNNYRNLVEEWNSFHQRYDDWRKTEGGCDRTEVLAALDQFSVQVNNLGRQARDLPQASYLLPMYTLLVEAAEREEGAIRALRNSWRPFNVDVFKAVDQERVNANRLRRQADIGLQELGERF